MSKENEVEEIKQKIRTFLEVKKELTMDACHFITKQLSEEYWEQWQEQMEETEEEDLPEEDDIDTEEPEEEDESIAEPVTEPKTIQPKSIRRLPPQENKLPVKPKITQEDIDRGDF